MLEESYIFVLVILAAAAAIIILVRYGFRSKSDSDNKVRDLYLLCTYIFVCTTVVVLIGKVLAGYKTEQPLFLVRRSCWCHLVCGIFCQSVDTCCVLFSVYAINMSY